MLRILESTACGEYFLLKEDVNSVVETVDGCFNILVPNLEIEGSFLYDTEEDGTSEEEIFPWDVRNDEDANRMYGILDDDDDDEGEEKEEEKDKSVEAGSDVPFLFFDENECMKEENANSSKTNGKSESSLFEVFSFSDLFSDDDDEVNNDDDGIGNKDDNEGYNYKGDESNYVVPGFVQGCTELVIELSDDGAANRVSESGRACVVDKLDECDHSMDRRLIPKVNAWIRDIDKIQVDRLYDEPVLVRRLNDCRKVATELLKKMNKKKSQRKQLKC